MLRDKKFWLDTLDGLLVAVTLVALDGAEPLFAAGSWQQFFVAATALGRATAIAAVINLRQRIRDRKEADAEVG